MCVVRPCAQSLEDELCVRLGLQIYMDDPVCTFPLTVLTLKLQVCSTSVGFKNPNSSAHVCAGLSLHTELSPQYTVTSEISKMVFPHLWHWIWFNRMAYGQCGF